MLYQNVACLRTEVLDYVSRVLYLTKGSDIAVVKFRAESSWNNSLERSLQLPFAFTGESVKIWVCSDPHVWSTGSRDNLTTAISDIDNNVGVDYVFVLGDIVSWGTVSDFNYYLEAKATSNVPFSRWYELAGNHDDNPTGDFSNFESLLAINNRNYTVDIGNIIFIFFGGLDESSAGHHPPTSINFLQSEVERNQNKNIFVLSHHAVYDTTHSSVDTYWYLKPNTDIQSIISSNRIDAWFHGHVHGMGAITDEYAVFKPLVLYEKVDHVEKIKTEPISLSLSDSIDIFEGIEFFHCPSAVISAFGTFKFGARPFGKNVIGNECIGISEDTVIKLNDKQIRNLSNNVTILESLARTVNYKLDLSSSLSISESLAKTLFVQLSDELTVILDVVANHADLKISDSISIAEIAETEYVGGREGKSEWKFLVKDGLGNTIASLTNARKRWLTQKLNKESEAGFVLDADDDNCNTTILNIGVNELHIEYKGTLIWAGQIVSTKKVANGNDTCWEVLAKDWVALLGKRFCGVESLREFTTTDAGTIAWTLIDETQSLVNGDFGITEGTVEASINRTTTYDKKNILSAITELSNMGKDGEANYGFDYEITPLKVFNVYYPYKGTIRNDVVFRYPGNCEDFEAFVNSWDIVNQEWGLGTHWTGTNSIVSRADATSQTTYKRREAIKTYGDMSVLAFLQDMVYQDVQWNKDPSTVIKFTSRVDAKTGILDYAVGDGVVVICDKFDIDEWLWVYERKIVIGDNDEARVNLLVGN